MRINKNAIAEKLSRSLAVEQTAEAAERSRFGIAKAQLIQDFNNHVVTKEIEAGPNATNISSTLGGRGNLFTFIGFPADSNPVQVVRDILENQVQLVKVGKAVRGESPLFFFKALVPEDELRAATPMPFESGNSWLFDIERGISGFSNYVYGKFGEVSRSGRGIQTEQAKFGGAFAPTPYMQTLLRNFITHI